MSRLRDYLPAFLLALAVHAGLGIGLGPVLRSGRSRESPPAAVEVTLRFIAPGPQETARPGPPVSQPSLPVRTPPSTRSPALQSSPALQPPPSHPQLPPPRKPERPPEPSPAPPPAAVAVQPRLVPAEKNGPVPSAAAAPAAPPAPETSAVQGGLTGMDGAGEPMDAGGPTDVGGPKEAGGRGAAVQVQPPQPLSAVEPGYPRLARRLGHEGVVRLRARVDAEGRVEQVEVLESSGHDSLDEAAVRAVRRTRFRPASRDGRSEAGTVTLSVRFELQD